MKIMLGQMIEVSGLGGLEALVNPNGKNSTHEGKNEQLGGTCVRSGTCAKRGANL